MVQDPRPLEVRGCRDDNDDVTKLYQVKERIGDCRPSAKNEDKPLSDLQLLSASSPGTKLSKGVATGDTLLPLCHTQHHFWCYNDTLYHYVTPRHTTFLSTCK